MRVTLMPVFVASLTASSSPSNFGLKVTVKAQSIIRPERQKRFYEWLILQKYSACVNLKKLKVN